MLVAGMGLAPQEPLAWAGCLDPWMWADASSQQEPEAGWLEGRARWVAKRSRAQAGRGGWGARCMLMALGRHSRFVPVCRASFACRSGDGQEGGPSWGV